MKEKELDKARSEKVIDVELPCFLIPWNGIFTELQCPDILLGYNSLHRKQHFESLSMCSKSTSMLPCLLKFVLAQSQTICSVCKV
jgi:hypothetical protein